MANKIVQLVDKNSNNLYPVAGAVIDNAVSTGAISSQAVTNPKIENGAVNGVENDATAIGTAKLALDTVGTPNLRDASVTSDKIDWTTYREISMSEFFDTINYVTADRFGAYQFGKLIFLYRLGCHDLPTNTNKVIIGTINSKYRPLTTFRVPSNDGWTGASGEPDLSSSGYTTFSIIRDNGVIEIDKKADRAKAWLGVSVYISQ